MGGIPGAPGERSNTIMQMLSNDPRVYACGEGGERVSDRQRGSRPWQQEMCADLDTQARETAVTHVTSLATRNVRGPRHAGTRAHTNTPRVTQTETETGTEIEGEEGRGRDLVSDRFSSKVAVRQIPIDRVHHLLRVCARARVREGGREGRRGRRGRRKQGDGGM